MSDENERHYPCSSPASLKHAVDMVRDALEVFDAYRHGERAKERSEERAEYELALIHLVAWSGVLVGCCDSFLEELKDRGIDF